MWRKRIAITVSLVGFTALVAGLSFAAGTRAVQPQPGALAARVSLLPPAGRSAANAPASSAPEDLEEAFAVFWDVWRIVENDFFGAADRQTMVQGAIRGMVEALGDPYTQYVDPQQNAIMREDDSGGFEGIGATVDLIDGRLTIISPLKGSPAEQAGLRAGDVILEVDGRPVAGLDLIEAVSLVRGPKDSTVTLTLQRDGVADPFRLSIVRAAISLITVESQMLNDRVAYLAVTSFTGRTVEELDANLRDLEQSGARALILDLRGNPGGFLDAAVETVSRFLDSGPALWWQNADGTDYAISVKSRRTFRWPMVVLVDEGSASAAEIVAGALQDARRATLLGQPTFGKGSVQNVHQLRDGGSVRVTTAHWLTRDKREISGVGLEPDLPVTQTETPPAGDAQLDAALRLLQKRLGLPRYTPFD